MSTIPTVSARSYSNSYVPAKEIKWLLQYGKDHKFEDSPYFVLSDRSIAWTLNQIDSLSIKQLKPKKASIKNYLSQPGNPKILVHLTTKLNPNTKVYEHDNDIDSSLKLNPLLFHYPTPWNRIELYELIDVDLGEEPPIIPSRSHYDKLTQYLDDWAKNLP